MTRLPETGERYGDQRLVSLLASMTSLPGLATPQEAPLPAALQARYAASEPPLTDRSAAAISDLSYTTLNRMRRGIPPSWKLNQATVTKLAKFLGVPSSRIRVMAAESENILRGSSHGGQSRGYADRIISDAGRLSESAQSAVSYLVSYLLAEQQAKEAMGLAIRNLVRVLAQATVDPTPAMAVGRALEAALATPDVPTHVNSLPPQVVSALSEALEAALEQPA